MTRRLSSFGFVLVFVACGTSASMVDEDAGEVRDSGEMEAGADAMDAGGMDAAVPDVGAADTGTADTSSVDTGASDTSAADTGVSDTGVLDTGVLDTGVSDAPDTDVTDADAAFDGADAAEAALPLACDLSKPFGALSLIPNVSLLGSDQTGGGLEGDELTIYFARHATLVTPVLYVASRASTADPFGVPVVLPGSVDTSGSQTASITADGLTLYFDPILSPSTDNHIWTATRASRSASFGSPAALAAVNSAALDMDPYVLPAGGVLYLASARAGGPFRIFRAPLGGGASPVEVTELTSAYQALAPVVTADELTIFFGSDRAGGGSYDIWVAQRTSTSTAFGTPTSVAELNTGSTDLPAWISNDGCRMVFISNRSGDDDIWVATRPL